MKVFSRIDWNRGVLFRQRVPMQDTSKLPANFEERPFTTREVTRLHADDFPLEQLRDLAEFTEWINQNVAPNVGDGIYNILAYGRHWQRWYKGRRVLKSEKGIKGTYIKKYYGLIALGKIEIKNGAMERMFKERGRRKINPRNKPTYPLWKHFH